MTTRRGFLGRASVAIATFVGIPSGAAPQRHLPFRWSAGTLPTVGDMLGDGYVTEMSYTEDRIGVRYVLEFVDHPWPEGRLRAAFWVSLWRKGKRIPPTDPVYEGIRRQVRYQALTANRQADKMCGWEPRKKLEDTPSEHLASLNL